MKALTLDVIAEAVQGHMISGNGDLPIEKITKDSRETSPDSLFFALIGQTHDAHEFLPQVATSGCKNWVVSHIEAKDLPEAKDANIILVEDTTNALMTLAAFVLDEMKAVKIGVTGSVGKTSTKDMIDAICSQKYMTGKTKGNLNTGIGISMCIFDFQPDTQVAVLEMGTDHPGEIKQVVERFKPHIGVITNIGQSHLEHFGTREGIFRAKLEIAGGFAPDDVLIIQKGKDFLTKEQIISHLKRPLRIVSVGKDMDNEFKVSNIAKGVGQMLEFDLTAGQEKRHFTVPVLGAHQAMNAAQAIAVGIELGISMEEAARGLLNLKQSSGRLNVKETKDAKHLTIIDDSYNASPDSMRSGILSLISMGGGRKVAILGDMLELGEETASFHREVGIFAAENGVDLIIGVGDLSQNLTKGAGSKGRHFPDKESLISALPQLINRNDVILIKASRGMALDEVSDYLLNTKETI